jgi:hypothetical protein
MEEEREDLDNYVYARFSGLDAGGSAGSKE